MRAKWDVDAEEAEVEHGYPRRPESRSKREEREGIPLQWLHSGRDAGRVLKFGLSRNLMDMVLADLPIGPSLERAISDVEQASARLAQDASLVALLSQARDKLAQLLPEVTSDAFGMGIAAVTERDLLGEFELTVGHLGDPVPVSRQSSGVSQLAIFVFAVQLAATCPGTIMLIDEPEISLHPQPQRALMRLLGQLDAQAIVTTHSSNLLDRADPGGAGVWLRCLRGNPRRGLLWPASRSCVWLRPGFRIFAFGLAQSDGGPNPPGNASRTRTASRTPRQTAVPPLPGRSDSTSRFTNQVVLGWLRRDRFPAECSPTPAAPREGNSHAEESSTRKQTSTPESNRRS